MKVVAHFPSHHERSLEEVAQKLREEGIYNIKIRELSTNFRSETEEEVFITTKEKKYFLYGMLIGGLIGLIIAWLVDNNIIFSPLFMPLFAGGRLVIYVFWTGLAMIVGSFLGSLIGLLYGTIEVDKGGRVLITYVSANNKKLVYRIIERHSGVII